MIKWERLPASTVKLVSCLLAFVRWRWFRIGELHSFSLECEYSFLILHWYCLLQENLHWLYHPVSYQGIPVPDQGIHTKAINIAYNAWGSYHEYLTSHLSHVKKLTSYLRVILVHFLLSSDFILHILRAILPMFHFFTLNKGLLSLFTLVTLKVVTPLAI